MRLVEIGGHGIDFIEQIPSTDLQDVVICPDPLRRGRRHLAKGWDPALPDTLRGWLVQRGLAAGRIE